MTPPPGPQTCRVLAASVAAAAARDGAAAGDHPLRAHARAVLDAGVSAAALGGEGSVGDGVRAVGLELVGELAAQTLAGGDGLPGPLGEGDVREAAALVAYHVASPASAESVRARCRRIALRLSGLRPGPGTPATEDGGNLAAAAMVPALMTALRQAGGGGGEGVADTLGAVCRCDGGALRVAVGELVEMVVGAGTGGGAGVGELGLRCLGGMVGGPAATESGGLRGPGRGGTGGVI